MEHVPATMLGLLPSRRVFPQTERGRIGRRQWRLIPVQWILLASSRFTLKRVIVDVEFVLIRFRLVNQLELSHPY